MCISLDDPNEHAVVRCPECGGTNGGHVRDHAIAPPQADAVSKSDQQLWIEVAYHQGNTTFGPIYERARALRTHPAMVELLRRAREDEWRRTDG